MAGKLITLLAELFKTDPAAVEAHFDSSTRWEGMDRLIVASMLESEYGITLEDDEVDRLTSPAATLQVLAHHGFDEG